MRLIPPLRATEEADTRVDLKDDIEAPRTDCNTGGLPLLTDSTDRKFILPTSRTGYQDEDCTTRPTAKSQNL